jgi:hypothetical protein
VLPTVEGREIWLRRMAKLDEEQQRILHQLQLQLPETSGADSDSKM